jgi:hypothetical protein
MMFWEGENETPECPACWKENQLYGLGKEIEILIRENHSEVRRKSKIEGVIPYSDIDLITILYELESIIEKYKAPKGQEMER